MHEAACRRRLELEAKGPVPTVDTGNIDPEPDEDGTPHMDMGCEQVLIPISQATRHRSLRISTKMLKDQIWNRRKQAGAVSTGSTT
jgi:hypothetical protein